MYDSTKANNVTFSTNDFSQTTHGYLNTTLDSTQKATFENLNHPRNVTIQPGGITDIWNNTNTAHLTATISDDDSTPPGLTAASYAASTAVLNITLSERLGSFNGTNIVLYDSTKSNNVTFSTNDFSQTTHGYLNTTLDSTQKATFENLNHPRNVTIQPGGITDIWNNTNTAHLTATISDDDSTPPGLTAASYAASTAVLNITLSERLGSFNGTNIVLYDSTKSNNVTFSTNDFSQTTHGYLNTTLDSTQKATFENLNHPRNVTIQPGGITDIWNNSNTAHLTAIISGDDTTPPGLTSASYTAATGVLNITLNERLNAFDDSKIALYDSSKANIVTFSDGNFAQSTHGYLHTTLNSAQKAAFENLNHPRNVTIQPGAITDIWNNSNTDTLTRTISSSDTTPPTLNNATYAPASGVLNLTLSETLAAHSDTLIELHDSSKQGNVTFGATNLARSGHTLTATLNSTQKMSFENLTHPRNVTIQPSAITDIWNNPNTDTLTYAISYADTTPPQIERATLQPANNTMTIRANERILPILSNNIIINDTSKTLIPSGTPKHSPGNRTLLTLNDTEMNIINTMSYPRSITVSKITDIWDNTAINSTAQLVYNYTSTPVKAIAVEIDSAVYAVATSNLTVDMNLPILPPTIDRIYLLDRSTELTVSQLTHINDTFVITLTNETKTAFENMVPPRNITILSGGVSDTQNRHNIDNLTKTITYVDATNPPVTPVTPSAQNICVLLTDIPDTSTRLVDASYNRESSIIHVTFNEKINTFGVDPGEFFVLTNLTEYIETRRAEPLTGATVLTQHNSHKLHLAVAEGQIPHTNDTPIYLAMSDTAVPNVAGNYIPGSVERLNHIHDVYVPVLESVSYLPDQEQLYVTFSQPLNASATNSTLFGIRDIYMTEPAITLSAPRDTHTGSPSFVLFDTSNHTGILSDMFLPVIDIGTGAVVGTNGISSYGVDSWPIIRHQNQNETLSIPLVHNATYNTITDTLWLDLETPDIMVQPDFISISNGTASITLSGARVDIYEKSSMASLSTTHPMYLDGDMTLHMKTGAILSESGMLYADTVPISVFDGLSTERGAETPVLLDDMSNYSHSNRTVTPLYDISLIRSGDDTLAVTLLKNQTGGMGILNVTEPANIRQLSFVAVNNTLDIDTINIHSVPHAAVLDRAQIKLYDMANPESPVKVATIPADSAGRGAITAITQDNNPYVAHAGQGMWNLLDISIPSDPKAIHTANISHADAPYYHMTGSDSLVVGSFDRRILHLIDISDITTPVLSCVDMTKHHDINLVDDTHLAGITMTGRNPGLAIIDTIGEDIVSFTPTGIDTVDVQTMTLYGIPYVLLTTVPDDDDESLFLIYDVRNSTNPEISYIDRISGAAHLDVTRIGGFTYAILADSNGVVYAIKLDSRQTPR